MIPLSFAQQRLWFMNRLEGPSPTYNVPLLLDLSGRVEADALALAWRDVVGRHESLRTVFREADGVAGQVVLGADDPLAALAVVSCGSVDELEEGVRSEQSHPFDLGSELPVRARLFRVVGGRHVLALVMHHIVSDGWSHGPLLRDLSEAYRARLAGQSPGWGPLPVQYADYALWQRELLGDEGDPGSLVRRELQHWKETLHGAPEELNLPTDRARPTEASNRGAHAEFIVPAGAHAGLLDLAHRRGATLFMALQAGVAGLLSRLGAGTDIPLGTVVAGRTEEELDELVGFFVNTLVLRTDVSGDPTFGELVERVRESDLTAYAHQDLPFEKLVEELNPARSLSRHPLFQVDLVLQNNTAAEFTAPGLSARVELGTTGTAKMDLSFAFEERYDAQGVPAGIAGTVEYATDLFDAGTVVTLTERLARLLTSVAADPDLPLHRIGILSPAEDVQLREGWMAKDVPLPERTVGAFLEDRVASTPEATALVTREDTLTYAALNTRVNRLAHHLVSLGVGPGTVVAAALPRTTAAVVTWLAIAKSGGTYAPIDLEYPVERIGYILRDAAPAVLVTTEAAAAELTAALGPLPPLVTDQLCAHAPEHNLGDADRTAPLRLDHGAYVIYTSGSTGRPKGVTVPHRALTNLWTDHVATSFPIPRAPAERLRVALSASLSFDTSWEGVLALVAGHELHLIDEHTRRDSAALIRYVTRHRVTMLDVTPSFAQELVAQGILDAESAPRVLLLGGEAVGEVLWTQLRDAPHTVSYNYYGPSEYCVEAAGCALDEYPSPSVGRPMPNTRIHVLDAHLNPVPPGVVGEMYLSGANLAKGYIGRAALTAERFVANPFGRPGERMYRSGDLARWTADGYLDFLGRADGQVKIRGFRIELGEVESAVAGCPGVTQSAVVVREDTPGDKRLVAYVVPAPGGGADPGALRRRTARTLPEYMIPSAFVALTELPRTQNGKLDTRALPAPDYAELAAGRAPRSPREEIVAQAFAHVLGLETVSLDANFFELGGHSLLATRLAARLRATLSVEIGLKQLFDTPTVAGLAESLGLAATDRPRLTAAAAGERPTLIPLSFAQQRLWFMNRLEGPSPTYNVPLLLDLSGRVEADALALAWCDVVGRHESLRTVFREADGVAGQVVLGADDPLAALAVVSCGSVDELEEGVRSEQSHPFDLGSELPVRARLFRVVGGRHVLALVMHHIVSDGWSHGPLLRDLSEAYRARLAGRSPGWGPLPVQYADYALWQRELLGDEGDPGSLVRRELQHWKETLHGAPEEIELPTDRPRPAVAGYTGGQVRIELPADVSAGLRRIARQTGATLFMVLQAGVAGLLSRLGAGTDIPLGTVVAGRTEEELDELVGFFVNTLVLRTDVSGDPTFGELVERVRESDLTAYAHQDLPFEKLVEELNPARSLSRHPLFQVSVELHNATGTKTAADDVLSPRPVALDVAKLDLTWDFVEEGEAVSGELGYADDLFDRETAERLVTWLRRLLTAAVTAPEMPVAALPLVSARERQLLLEERHRTQHADLERGVVRRIRDHALATPEAVAVTGGAEGPVTYRELTGRASALSRALVDEGCDGDRGFVAVLADRGAGVITALLAALGAGATYLPLDTEAPLARNAARLADTGARHLVVDAAHAEVGRRLAAGAAHPVEVVPLGDVVADPPEDLAPIAHGPDDRAYVIFTSGSTGRPKGAMVQHRGLVNNLLGEAEAMGISDHTDTVVSSAPLTFDISVWQMLTALIFGGRVHTVETATARDPRALFAAATAAGATVLQVVPSLLRAALEEWDAVGGAPSGLPLRALAVTGEALPPDLCRGWLRRYPRIPLVNCYGPTECSDDVTQAVIGADAVPEGARAPIGVATRGIRLYVLDDRLQLAPLGVTGELYIGGVGVGLGYLADAPRTASAFVPDPYAVEPGARMYRTGDLVRYRRDGQLEFLSRRDHQVKIRGQRIEPGEVESVLLKLDGVRDAAVLALPGPDGQLRLVGYYVGEPSPRRVRDGLAAQVSEAMVPGVLVPMDAFPLTANGKLDRAALPEPEPAAPRPGRAPRTPREAAVCEVFAEVLGVAGIGADDSFFERGGHSLLALRLMRRLNERLGTALPLGSLFERPSPAGLAALLDEGPPPAPHDAGAELAMRLRQDAVLDPAIDPAGSAPFAYDSAHDPRAVLLTGATGFLGSFLLRELLRRTSATVYCLIRAADDGAAAERLRRMPAGAGPGEEALRHRIVPLAGDLGAPMLGLGAERYHALARVIDAVHHNGARVNLAESYEALRAANVGGVQEILRFAALHRVKAVHYVSTISTVVAPEGTPEVLPEDWISDPALLGSSGYVASKWVAERLVLAAQERGIPVSVHRPSRIGGDTATGAVRADDAFWLYTRACAELGARPARGETGLWESIVPVDFAARAIVQLALTTPPDGTVYSLTAAEPVSLDEVLDHTERAGYPMVELPYAQWRHRLTEAAMAVPDGALSALPAAAVLAGGEDSTRGREPVRFDRRNLLRGLAATGMSCPSTSAELLDRQLAYFVREGLLPPSGASRSPLATLSSARLTPSAR
ncbi:amino acid adenylation domain-containing protein [Streptomyces sp. NPDC088923]|uniref:non-ribosomal peptide synthetase n=1 Tax=Streptomyces sp. NPDC088923 TaxID=3365913 RepID=UPI0037F78582